MLAAERQILTGIAEPSAPTPAAAWRFALAFAGNLALVALMSLVIGTLFLKEVKDRDIHHNEDTV